MRLINERWRSTRLGAFFHWSERSTIEIQKGFVGCHSPKHSIEIQLIELTAVEIKAGVFWSKVWLTTSDGKFLVRGLPNAAAREMVRELRRAANAAKVSVLTTAPSPFLSWAISVDNAFDLGHWVTFEELQTLWRRRPEQSRIGFDLDGLVRDLQDDPDLKAEADAKLRNALSHTPSSLAARTEEHNRRFADQEARTYAAFFRTVEKSPLNQEQIASCICFDNCVLTVAAAGSGKTSTIVAKAGYALSRKIVEPDEVLMLAFNADSAKELRQRVFARLGHLGVGAEVVTAKTFHKLGLEIIGKATGRKPRVAPWLETGQDIEAVAEIISDLRKADPAFRVVAALFQMVLSRNLAHFEDDPEPDAWEFSTRKAGFKTMRGEVVKSQEERLIADWLFYNGVNYEYEKPYEVDTVTPTRSQYQPDFFYPDVQVYHEHFALDESGQPPEYFGKEYLDGVEWKRGLHKEHGTTLLETTSFGLRSGNDLSRLQIQLESLGVVFVPDPEREVSGRTPPSDLEIARTFRSFLIHAKSNRLSIEDLRSRAAANGGAGFGMRQTAFLLLYEKIAAEWDRRLRGGEYVDFEDMLNLATDLVASGKWKSPYRLVMVDEFQDVSKARAELARVLVSGEERFLFAVGDDWQAINRFAGADISLMSRFEETFGPAQRLSLQETFRSPQLLCDIASDFVLKNRAQIQKKVISSQPVFGPPVQVYSCNDSSREALLEKHLQVLYDRIGSAEHPARDDGRVSVLLLGRYNREMPARLRQWRDSCGDRIRLDFLSIHASKGLEADYVFIVKMSSDRYSFPSMIEDDPILLLAMPGGDNFAFAEERRLFYVALTRARRMVLIYCDKRTPSAFIEELQTDERVTFVGGRKRRCPSCDNGFVVKRVGPYSEFWGCSRFPACRFTEQDQASSAF